MLQKTYGVPLLQQQAMKIAIVGAGFSSGESDKLQRAMASSQQAGGVGVFCDKFIIGILAGSRGPRYLREPSERP